MIQPTLLGTFQYLLLTMNQNVAVRCQRAARAADQCSTPLHLLQLKEADYKAHFSAHLCVFVDMLCIEIAATSSNIVCMYHTLTI